MLVKLLGAPVQDGAGRRGCDMGPASFRAAGLAESLVDLGHEVVDLGDVGKAPLKAHRHANAALKQLAETVAWIEALSEAAYLASADGMPIFSVAITACRLERLLALRGGRRRTAGRCLCSGSMHTPISILW